MSLIKYIMRNEIGFVLAKNGQAKEDQYLKETRENVSPSIPSNMIMEFITVEHW